MVEGNHRMSAACRCLYGMDLESRHSEFSSEHPLPHAMSTIANTTNLVVVHMPCLKDFTDDFFEIPHWASLKLQEACGIVLSGSWNNAMQIFLRKLPRVETQGYLHLLKPKRSSAMNAAMGCLVDHLHEFATK